MDYNIVGSFVSLKKFAGEPRIFKAEAWAEQKTLSGLRHSQKRKAWAERMGGLTAAKMDVPLDRPFIFRHIKS